MRIASTLAFVLLFVGDALAATLTPPEPAIYIVPAAGFQTSLMAAMQKSMFRFALSGRDRHVVPLGIHSYSGKGPNYGKQICAVFICGLYWD